MVSPLQHWQPSEPKGLWPALGGLSVLLHVGILGLSLPYWLDLIRPSGRQEGSEVTPIELVTVEPAADSATDNSAAAQASSAQPTASQRNSSKAVQSEGRNPVVPTTGERGASRRPVAEPDATNSPSAAGSTASGSTRFSPTQPSQAPARRQPSGVRPAENRESGEAPEGFAPDAETEPPTETQSDTQPETQSDTQSDTQPGTPLDPPTDTPLGQSPGQQSGQQPSEETEAEPANNSESGIPGETGELPSLPGENLPPPLSGGGSETAQAAFISIVGSQEVPREWQRDLTDSPPQLARDGSSNRSIELSLPGTGCGPVDFSKGAATYRVKISAQGTVERATPWLGEAGGSSEQDAIACLIESAGFTFIPAMLDGQPWVSDNLLITVEVVESTGEPF